MALGAVVMDRVFPLSIIRRSRCVPTMKTPSMVGLPERCRKIDRRVVPTSAEIGTTVVIRLRKLTIIERSVDTTAAEIAYITFLPLPNGNAVELPPNTFILRVLAIPQLLIPIKRPSTIPMLAEMTASTPIPFWSKIIPIATYMMAELPKVEIQLLPELFSINMRSSSPYGIASPSFCAERPALNRRCTRNMVNAVRCGAEDISGERSFPRGVIPTA